jgi:signal transduction histidine kinase
VNTIVSFVLLLIALFTALLSKLFKSPAPETAPVPTAAPTISPELTVNVPFQTPGWVELFQNILFWAFFIAIIFFAFRYYLGQRKELIIALRNLPILRFLKRAWLWLRAGFLRFNRAVSSMVETGLARVRALARQSSQIFDPLIAVSRRLPPRQRILLIYLAMIRWNSHNGIYRKGSETPNEYAGSLCRVLPEAEADISVLTGSFMEARYTRHPITKDQAEGMQAAWERFQGDLRDYLEAQKQSQNQP